MGWRKFKLFQNRRRKSYFHGINNSDDLNGYYEGKLGEEEMKCLIDILKCVGLDYFPEQMGEVVMIDGTYVKFKFRYNKKKKTAKDTSLLIIVLNFIITCMDVIKMRT